MKAIILAAGRGTRLKPLTDTIPKPMICIAGKPIIEYTLENIYSQVDEIIIVVKYLSQKFIDYFGDNYKNTKITYFEQGEDKGTGGAIRGIKFEDDFLLINGDSIFEKKDIDNLINLENYGALVLKTETPEKYGIFEQNSDNFAIKIVEKPTEFIGNLANLGVYKFSSEMLKLVNEIELSSRGEYEITDAINLFIKQISTEGFSPLQLLKLEGKFIDIGYPWDILSANKYFLEKIKKSELNGEVENGVNIKGNIILGKGSILKSGTYIEGNVIFGENCIIGPNCYIRGNSVFGNNSKVGNAVEIKNSSIGNNTNIGHLSYVGDSIIGNNCNFGAGFKVANLRHDGKNMRAMLKGKLVETGLKKLGIILGNNSKLGINTLCYPARIFPEGFTSLPGEIIK
ncbi:MAG: sugar phosphate nucleotidyltransferase [Candidatus Gracilibacteria bacterium]|nr:sugar phosphate nucleotidyltransferase [Candidatus Gracilibacteria bacterium]MDQ7022735.1 sugar phosphate nucleotidyltransferase [Candidatus Gracilibacteria bacterium]